MSFALVFFSLLCSGQGFEITSPGPSEKTDEMGGISEQDITALDQKRLSNAFKSVVKKHLKDYRDGRVSAGRRGSGRYSGVLEGHLTNSVNEHEGANNGLEKTVEVAILGTNQLRGKNRKDKLEEARLTAGGLCKFEKDEDGNITSYLMVDGLKVGGKADPDQEEYVQHDGNLCANLSGGIIDRGPAHGGQDRVEDIKDSEGNSIGKRLMRPLHRVYEVSKEVRDAVGNADDEDSAGNQYARRAISDATWKEFSADGDAGLRRAGASRQVVQRGEKYYSVITTKDGERLEAEINPDLSMLQSEFSWMEGLRKADAQNRAIGLSAARLAGFPSDVADNAFAYTQLKNLAAKGESGNLDAVAERVSLMKEVGGNSLFCPNGSLVNPENPDCEAASPPSPPGATTPKVPDMAQAVSKIQQAFSSIRMTKAQAQEFVNSKLLASQREQLATGGSGLDEATLNNIIQSASVKDISKVLHSDQTQQLFQLAEGNLSKKQKARIAQDAQKIISNDCLSPDSFCYAPVGVAATEALIEKDEKELLKKRNDGTITPKQYYEQLAKVREPYTFTKISGDPGHHFTDTRELIYKRLVRATEGPLSQWMTTMENLDFSKQTDRATESKPYQQMQAMWDNAMAEYNAVKKSARDVEKARKAINSDARMQNQYTTSAGYNANNKSHMHLFGARIGRDAQTIPLDGDDFVIPPAIDNSLDSRTGAPVPTNAGQPNGIVNNSSLL